MKPKEAENNVVLEKIVSVDHFTSNLAILLMIVCTGLGATGMYSVMQCSNCKLTFFSVSLRELRNFTNQISVLETWKYVYKTC